MKKVDLGRLPLGAFALAFLMADLATPSAMAQQAADGSNQPAELMEIIVTARKREESLLKTPVTLSAITTEDIEKRGIVSVADIAANTPGLNLNNNSTGRADRSFQQLVLRGFTPSTVLATTTSMFIDGVPVSSPSAFTAISNPERVEVLKGPQSAYFGRNTFAGAVNVVNKEPGDEWAGSVTGMIGTRENYQVKGEIEGPILGEALTFRASYDKFSKEGSWKNAYDGGTLGDQSSTTKSLLLVAKPSEKLTLKAFGMFSKDDDGPAANTRISAITIRDAAGNVVVQGQSNCTLNGKNPYICGVAPSLANPVSANTLSDSFITNFLANPAGRLIDPDDGVQDFGLIRRNRHLHLTGDYEVNDEFTLSFLTGYNHEEWSQISDLDGFDSTSLANPFGGTGSRSYFDFPYLVERKQADYSAEGRVSYDNGPFRGVLGVSYLNAWDQTGLGGGNGALGTTVFSGVGGKNRSRNMGAFFGSTYDVTPELSVSLEGRYQIDTLFAYAPPTGLTTTSSAFIPAGTYEGGSVVVKKTFHNFLPRAIVNYQIKPDLMAYGSVARGANPGAFNAGILGYGDALQQAAVNAGLGIAVDPEIVTNYELGLKGMALDGDLRFTTAAYYSQWRDQINSITLTVPDPSGSGTTFVSGSANSGSVDLYGIEADILWRLTDIITINAAGSINLSDIKKFISPTITGLTGITDFTGNEQPNTSKYSATAGVNFGDDIQGMEDASWFARADWVYKSGVWSNQANIVRTKASHVFNGRVGVAKGDVSLEVFIKNAFNNKAYTSIGDNWAFDPYFSYLSTYSSLIVGLPELRTVGVQMKVKF